ncbi:2-keto-4-pentenoate hydratase [Diaphorobacter caeni]|uniref:2-keto-4-pentenoate hydratase n=1 Tax=Diaphorobacter caeni TaxID=2784387 RepID=UPI00188F2955|nr:fumarylacetoacetate hydrolase family protein [Diaphorobacter caeni]MBF5007734.1 fumarylacetoacetate hydrolase family protein [Diaphorobacter caeni]
MNINDLARKVDSAAHEGRAIAQIDPQGKLSMDDAYAIQSAAMQLRLARGARRTGVKMGFTSRAKMVQMGIDDVIWGRLSSDMLIEDGGTLDFSRFVHPRVEPELAFMLKRPIAPDATLMEALAAVEAIAPALEVIDSRYEDFKFSLPDVVADNASSSGYVIGAWHDPKCDFSNLGLVMSMDDALIQIGSTAAILGHPLRSLVAAARLSASAGEPLQAGWVVLAGGATPAEWIKRGQYVSVEMEGLGRTGFHVSA